MDQKKISYGFLAVLILISFVAPKETRSEEAKTEARSLSFPAPAPEIAGFIGKWYGEKGYRVNRVSVDGGGMKLTAEKGEKRFDLFLFPNSAIGVRITWDRSLEDPQVKRLVRELHTYLNEAKNPDYRLTEGESDAVPDLVLRKINAVVCIRSSGTQDENRFSGFIIERGGLILTTAHGITNTSTVTLTYHDGRRANGKVIRSDIKKDLALIQADQGSGNAISLSEGRDFPEMGDSLYGAGCSDEHGIRVYSGVMEGLPVKVNGILLFQVNMPVHPGNSGSPVFDQKGHLVSMVKARFKGSDSIGFLIPLPVLTAFLEEE